MFPNHGLKPLQRPPFASIARRHLHLEICSKTASIAASPHASRHCLFPTATPSLPIPPPLAQLTLFILNHLSKASTATFPANLFLSIPLLQSIFSSRLSSPSCKTICYTAFSAQCMPELKAIQLFCWNTTQVPHPKLPDTHELQLLEAKPLSTGLDMSVFKVLSVKFCCSCFQCASPIYFETLLVLHFPIWSLIPSQIIISCLMLIFLKLLPDYVSLRPFTDT